jgi:hypothetical protein
MEGDLNDALSGLNDVFSWMAKGATDTWKIVPRTETVLEVCKTICDTFIEGYNGFKVDAKHFELPFSV